MPSSSTQQLTKAQLNHTDLRVITHSDVDDQVAYGEEQDFILDVPKNSTVLSQLIFSQNYNEAIQRLCRCPEEALTWICLQIDRDFYKTSASNDEVSEHRAQGALRQIPSARKFAFKQLPIHMACNNLSCLPTHIDESKKTQKLSLEKLIIHLALTYPTGCSLPDHYGRYPLHQVLGDSRCLNGDILVSKETLSILLMAAPQIANRPDKFGRLPVEIVGGTLSVDANSKESRISDDDNEFETDTVYDMLNRGPDFWLLARHEAMLCLQHQSLPEGRKAEIEEKFDEKNVFPGKTNPQMPAMLLITENVSCLDEIHTETNGNPNMHTEEVTDERIRLVDKPVSSTADISYIYCSNVEAKNHHRDIEMKDSPTVKTEEMSDDCSATFKLKTPQSNPVDNLNYLKKHEKAQQTAEKTDKSLEILIKSRHFFTENDEKQDSLTLSPRHNNTECSCDDMEHFLPNVNRKSMEDDIMISSERIIGNDSEMSTISTSPTQSISSSTDLADRVVFLKQMLSESFHANYELTQKLSELQEKVVQLNEDAEYWKDQFHVLNEKSIEDSTNAMQANTCLQGEIQELRQQEAQLRYEVKCLNIALEANGVSYLVPRIQDSSCIKENSIGIISTVDINQVGGLNPGSQHSQHSSFSSNDIRAINHEHQKLEREICMLKEKEQQYLSEQQVAKDRISMLEKIVELASQPRKHLTHQVSEAEVQSSSPVRRQSGKFIKRMVSHRDTARNIEGDYFFTASEDIPFEDIPLSDNTCRSENHTDHSLTQDRSNLDSIHAIDDFKLCNNICQSENHVGQSLTQDLNLNPDPRSITPIACPVPLKPTVYRCGKTQSRKADVAVADRRRMASFIPIRADNVIDVESDFKSGPMTGADAPREAPKFSNVNSENHVLMHIEAPILSSDGMESPSITISQLQTKTDQVMSTASRQNPLVLEAKRAFVDLCEISENSMAFNCKPIEIEDAELAYAATLHCRKENHNDAPPALESTCLEVIADVNAKTTSSLDKKNDDLTLFFKSLLTTNNNVSNNHRPDGKPKQSKKSPCTRGMSSCRLQDMQIVPFVQQKDSARRSDESDSWRADDVVSIPLVQHRCTSSPRSSTRQQGSARQSDESHQNCVDDVDSILTETEVMFGLKLSPEIVDAWHAIKIDESSLFYEHILAKLD